MSELSPPLPPPSGLRRRRRRHSEAPETVAQIELSPLIDMVFILLIFFVVTTTFERNRAVPVQRPSARAATIAAEGAVILSITADGRLLLEDSPIHPDDPRPIRAALAGRVNRAILLQADARVPTALLLRVMDAALAAGASGVSLMADAPREGRP